MLILNWLRNLKMAIFKHSTYCLKNLQETLFILPEIHIIDP